MTDPISFELYRNPKQPQQRHNITDYNSRCIKRNRRRRVFKQRMNDALLGAVFAVIPLLILMML